MRFRQQNTAPDNRCGFFVNQSLGNKLNNDYASVPSVKKGIIYPSTQDGTNFTMRPILSNNIFQITKNDIIELMRLDTSGNVNFSGAATSTDFITTTGVYLSDLYKFNIFSAMANGICSNALSISTTQYADVNKPQIASIHSTTALPSGFRFGVRLVFVLDPDNIMVVLIGRGVAGDLAGLNIWLNQYTVGGTWCGWKALS